MSKFLKALAIAGAMITCASVSAAQTPALQDGFVDVPAGKLWYETCGSGPRTMVLIHDGVMPSAGWDYVWPALCKSFHVIRYDRRGYGRSPMAPAPFSQVADLQAVMTALGVQHSVLVGSSNGGGIAIDFTLAHPDEVDRLVLVGPEVSGIPHSKYFVERGYELIGRAAKGDFKGAITSSWLLAPGDEANVEKVLQKADPRIASRPDLAAPEQPAAARLGEIKALTLVVVGEYDVSDNQAEAGVVEYAIPGASRVVVRKAGHLVYISEPAEFADLVTRFATGEAAPSPGAEATLRRAIGGLQQGAPDYAVFDPRIGPNLRPQVVGIRDQLAPYGAIQSVTFKGKGPDGVDIFIVAYAKRSLDWRMILGPDGKVTGLFFKPIP
jgi:pimeloyl-ACP methyl ester carboxylesterase